MAGSGEESMKRDIFKKAPLSEKKALFRKACFERIIFNVKGEQDEILYLVIDEYVDQKVLIFGYAANSPYLLSNQKIVLNFSHGDDRYFMHASAEVIGNRIHVSAENDVYILQRRKSPRLDIPDHYPGGFNIIGYQGKVVMYQCLLKDFGSGGCRVQYKGHIPLFKAGDQIRGVVHLNYRKPVELDCEIKYHVTNPTEGTQTFGIQFKLNTTFLENKMLVVFMDLQRELFVKWSSSNSE